LKQIQKHKIKWKKRKTNIEQKMKEVKEERIKRKEEFTSHKRSRFSDPSLQYHIAMEP
jgi:hypothetical protein